MLHVKDRHSKCTQYLNCYVFKGFSTYWRFFPIEEAIVSAVDGPSVVSSFSKNLTAINDSVKMTCRLGSPRLRREKQSEIIDSVGKFRANAKTERWRREGRLQERKKKTTLNETVVNRQKAFSYHLYHFFICDFNRAIKS